MGRKGIRLAVVMLALALMPLTARATTYTWSPSQTSGTWNTTTNWSGTPPAGGPSGTANSATINNATSTNVTLNSTVGSLGTLTIGSADTLTLATGGSLKSNAITLNGGSIKGTGGTLTGSTPISGYGTVSALPGVGTVTANSGTYGNTMNINNVTSSLMTLGFGSKGSFNLNNVTVGATGNTGNALTFSGSTTYSQFTNPLAGTFGNNWGNNDYGLVNITGNTTINGGITLSNYYTMNITNSTLTLNNPGTISGFNSSSPPLFVLGTGGNLNITGNTSLGNSAPIPINGGSITHTGGTFSANSFIGNGSISGVTSIVGGGNVIASGGTLTFDAGTGVSMGSTSGSGANFSTAGANNILNLKGTINYVNPGNIAPNGGTIQLNNATINTGAWNVALNPGTVNVTNNSTIIGAITSAANLTIQSGKNLNASGATFINNGTVTNNGGTASWGNFTNNGVYSSDPSTQTFNNLTVGAAGYLTGAAGDVFKITGNFVNNSAQSNAWNTLQAALAFATGTSNAHSVALGGADLGRTAAGFTNNFAWNSLDLTGQTLTLTDGNTTPGGALYVEDLTGLTFSGSTVTDITGNGLNIYYDPSVDLALGGKTFNLEGGGILAPDTAPVPEPGTMMMLGFGLLGLAVYGKRFKRV